MGTTGEKMRQLIGSRSGTRGRLVLLGLLPALLAMGYYTFGQVAHRRRGGGEVDLPAANLDDT
jgi:hypothetical protein